MYNARPGLLGVIFQKRARAFLFCVRFITDQVAVVLIAARAQTNAARDE